MRIGSQVVGSFAVLLLLQIATSLVAISLLGRMSPAIGSIMRENVVSAEAVEEMALALAHSAPTERARERFSQALRRAEDNVTEPEEQAPLEELDRWSEGALAQDARAREHVIDALRRLGTVNRAAMANARDDATNLGTAGGWAAAILGFLGLGVSFFAVANLRRRVLTPLNQIGRVITEYRSGEARARCTLTLSDSEDIALVERALNDLLDEHERNRKPEVNMSMTERMVLLRLLDERPEPVVIVDATGVVLAANRAAGEVLAGDSTIDLRAALESRADDESLAGIARVDLVGTGGAVCVLRGGS